MVDAPLVLTLDAGGTSFVFSAIQRAREVVEPLVLPSLGHDLEASLGQVIRGFSRAHEATGKVACALSVGFPGPADYPKGIIGDLGNLPGYRGGVALGPMLEDHFHLPVFLNNDADLFAYGEAKAGRLPEVNAALEAGGCAFRHRNLLGLTLGTGLGGGMVVVDQLLRGDNASGGSPWLLRSKRHPDCFAEEDVSIRAVRRVYLEASGLAEAPEPKVIAAIARGVAPGHQEAAQESFRALGEAAGDVLAQALTLVDGLVVIGGGLSGAADLFLPALMEEVNGTLQRRGGGPVPRLESKAFNLEDAQDRLAFLAEPAGWLSVPGSGRQVEQASRKRVGVCVTRLGTSNATALGAWAYAMEAMGRA